MDIKSLIRTIPDYPKTGIQFRDITTLLADSAGFQYVIDTLYRQYAQQNVHKIVGIDARGFIIGAALAYKLQIGFVPVRKAGKLPAQTISQSYALEYGSDILELHHDAINTGERILIIDDLIATGGTATATVALVQSLQAHIVACAFVIDLPELGGMQRLHNLGVNTYSICQFAGQ